MQIAYIFCYTLAYLAYLNNPRVSLEKKPASGEILSVKCRNAFKLISLKYILKRYERSRENKGVHIDSCVLGFGYIEWACKKITILKKDFHIRAILQKIQFSVHPYSCERNER